MSKALKDKGLARMNMKMTFTVLLCACGFCLAAQEEPSRPSDTAAPPMLEKLHAKIEQKLGTIDTALGKAAATLASTGMDGAEARKVLAELRKIDAAVIDCVTINPAGKIVTVEPATYKQHEGADISDQEHVKKVQATKKPTMSNVFKAVEGMEAVDIEYPILSKDGSLIGAVSVLLNPGRFLGAVIFPIIKHTPLDAYVAQKDGRILFDADPEEIGRNILTDAAYAKQEEIVNFFKLVASREKGRGPFEARPEGKAEAIFVEGHWATIRLHGAEWRLIVTKALSGDVSSGHRTAAMLGLSTAEEGLRKLATTETVKKAMTAGKDADVLEALMKYYTENAGLYAVQWVDAKGVNRIGYPKENSLIGYDFNAPTAIGNTKILEALKGRKETTFDDKLIEGQVGAFFLVPVFDGETYCGMLYIIR